jgi:hypothetical protein
MEINKQLSVITLNVSKEKTDWLIGFKTIVIYNKHTSQARIHRLKGKEWKIIYQASRS